MNTENRICVDGVYYLAIPNPNEPYECFFDECVCSFFGDDNCYGSCTESYRKDKTSIIWVKEDEYNKKEESVEKECKTCRFNYDEDGEIVSCNNRRMELGCYDGVCGVCGVYESFKYWESIQKQKDKQSNVEFRVNDKVSLIYLDQDFEIIKGEVKEVYSDKIKVRITDDRSCLNLSSYVFNLNGSFCNGHRIVVYHGWNISDVSIDVKGEEIPKRTKWVTCTYENTFVGDTVQWRGDDGIIRVDYKLKDGITFYSEKYGERFYDSYKIELPC